VLKHLLGEQWQQSDLIFKFVALVLRVNREAYLPEIIKGFNGLYDDFEGKLCAEITVAEALSLEFEEQLVAFLEGKSGKKVYIRRKVSKKILGGFVVRFGNSVIDGSVATQLNFIMRSESEIAV
jgi:F-type H+-transporting ATPase subunit delta